jgi:riboflavin kinase/FMN adenylyltransferase
MFDGVHRGHRFVLRHVCDYARAHGLSTTVITFDRHPREVVHTDWQPQLLTTFEERMGLLKETGIDRCVILPFNKEMAALSAREFMSLMVNRLGVKVLMTGYDNRFGHNRNDTFEDYVRYGEEIGVKVR